MLNAHVVSYEQKMLKVANSFAGENSVFVKENSTELGVYCFLPSEEKLRSHIPSNNTRSQR